MKIEQEIKQSHFLSARIKAMVNILLTNNQLQGMLKAHIEPHGITPQQYNVLRILRGQYPNFVSLAIIRERMLDKMSDTSRIIDRLELKGLVEKFSCKKDRRLVDIRISKLGLQLLKDTDNLETQYDEKLSTLSDEEAEVLSNLLDKLRESIIT